MADPKQPPDIDRRVRFFNNQFLTEQDMTAEQNYHLDRERRLIRQMYTPGIVNGLEVALGDPGKVVVKSGTAIDAAGRQIVLASDRTLLLTVGDANASHADNVLPFQPIAGQSPQPWLLAISYSEVEDPDSTTRVGSQGKNRWLEAPAFALLQEGNARVGTDFLVLGKLSLSISEQNSVSINPLVPGDQNVRVYSGLTLRGPLSVSHVVSPEEIQVEQSLRVTGTSNFDGGMTIGSANSRSTLTINNASTVNSSLTVTGTLTATGTTNLGTTNLNGNLTVGTTNAPASLTVRGLPSDAHGGDIYLGDQSGSNLRLGHSETFTWIQSSSNKPLAVNPLGNSVQVGKVMADQERLVASAPMEIGTSFDNTSDGTTVKPLLTMYRPGVPGSTWSNFAQFGLSRFKNDDVNARTQLVLQLTDTTGIDFHETMSWRSDGTVRIKGKLTFEGNKPIIIKKYVSSIASQPQIDTGYSFTAYAAAIAGFSGYEIKENQFATGAQVSLFKNNGNWYIQADFGTITSEQWNVWVMFIDIAWCDISGF